MRTTRPISSSCFASVGGGCAVRFGYALAFIVFGLLNPSPQMADAQGEPRQEKNAERTYSTLFDPSRQHPVSVESHELAVALKESEKRSTCPAGRAFVFEVKRKPQGQTGGFRICNETAQVDQAYIINGERAAIVGRVQSSTSVVNLVDLRSGQVLDEFWCFDPSVSPSNRFVAYGKVFPLHFVPGVSYEYLVYDLTASPSQNRTPPNRGHMSDRINVGWPVYPPGLLNSPGDNILNDQSVAHSMYTEGFFWLDRRDRFAFVDRWGGVDQVVVADLSAGIRNPSVSAYPIHATAIVDFAACKGKISPSGTDPSALIHVIDIQLPPGAAHFLRLRLAEHPCLVRTTLDLPLNEVRPPTTPPAARTNAN